MTYQKPRIVKAQTLTKVTAMKPVSGKTLDR